MALVLDKCDHGCWGTGKLPGGYICHGCSGRGLIWYVKAAKPGLRLIAGAIPDDRDGTYRNE